MGYDIELGPREKQELLRIARATLREFLSSGIIPPGSPHNPSLATPAGVFVTLRKQDELRGCIGTFSESSPLYRAIQEMAVQAATRDPRFPPVCASELPDIAIEISILRSLEHCSAPPAGIEIGRHGLHITHRTLRGVLLPQVAVESGWNAEEFLVQTCRKAGLEGDAWQKPEVRVEVFSALVFTDREIAELTPEGRELGYPIRARAARGDHDS